MNFDLQIRQLEVVPILEFTYHGQIPSLNHIYGQDRRTGRRYLKPEGKMFKTNIRSLIKTRPPEVMWYTVETWFERQIVYKNGKPYRWDMDDYYKLIFDAVSKKIGIDDCRFRRHIAEKNPGKGTLLFRLYPWKEDQWEHQRQ